MLRHWSLCFLLPPCYLRTPYHASGYLVTASPTDLEERFLLSGVFYLTLLSAGFKASLEAGSSTSKLAGLHADLLKVRTDKNKFMQIKNINTFNVLTFIQISAYKNKFMQDKK